MRQEPDTHSRRHSRRHFLGKASIGLAAVGASTWTLRAGATVTPESGELGDFANVVDAPAHPPAIPTSVPPVAWTATEDNIEGPYFRAGAPYRGKITPPLEPGKTLLVRGRVWSLKSRSPLPHATLDIWQANKDGRYDNDDPRNPPEKNVFVNRARLITDETGYYEYETILPGRYQTAPDEWRPAHIHYLVRADGHASLITQLYFEGDPMNEEDRFIKPSLIIDPSEVAVGDKHYLDGVFDVVLAATS